MAQLIRVQAIDQFEKILRVPESAISKEILGAVRQLDERRELEPALQQILSDPNETPHGPTEIADIITSRVILNGEKVNAAFILKGKSFQKVKSVDIAHQIMKIRQLPDLGLIVLCAIGDIQDDAHRDFVTGALDAGVNYLILDRLDTARLLLAYEKICPEDGTPFSEEGRCLNGHQLDRGIRLEVQVREKYRYEVLSLRDISHGGAKRYSAIVLLDPHYGREIVRAIITEVTEDLKNADYHRNEMVESHWSKTPAHVVWLFVAGVAEDVRHTNWLARSQWISPELDEQWRPIRLEGDEEISGISIKWNSMYESMRDFHSSNTASKGDALKILEPLIHEAIEYGKEGVVLIQRFDKGEINKSTIETELANRGDKVRGIYQKSGELPFPPADLQDYDQACQALFADIDNIYLPFTELGKKTWSTFDQRIQLSKSYIGAFEKDLERWNFEREKIH
jgi:hypothetical protein